MSENKNDTIETLTSGAGALGCITLYVLAGFPGGTIFMSVMVDQRDLDGWDWVLSVVLPGYGLFKGLFG